MIRYEYTYTTPSVKGNDEAFNLFKKYGFQASCKNSVWRHSKTLNEFNNESIY